MKKKMMIIILTFDIILIMTILLLFICSDNETEEIIVINAKTSIKNNVKNEITPDPSISINIEDVGKHEQIENIDYLYSKLDKFHQKMYEAILNQMNHTNEMDYNTEVFLNSDLVLKFKEDYLFVMSCVLDDHPEKFPYKKNYYEVTWKSEKINNETSKILLYQQDKIDQYDEMMDELNYNVNLFLTDIDMNGSQYNTALQIHDKLIDLLEYEHNYEKIDEENSEKNINTNSHIRDIYGAFVESSGGKNKVVCEGYAEAYLYLLKKCNIKCVKVSGYNGFSDVYEEAVEDAKKTDSKHAWNIAYLDCKWYEIDTTFDDFNLESLNQNIQEYMIADENYIYNREHMFWARTTHDMRYYTLGEGVTFGMDGERKKSPKDFYYYVYFRDNDKEVIKLDEYMSYKKADMLPIAVEF